MFIFKILKVRSRAYIIYRVLINPPPPPLIRNFLSRSTLPVQVG
nr:MAG TPA: hypothetical protein [Caudoviricetes sp.]